MEKEWKIAGVSLLVGMLAGLGIAYLIDRFGKESNGGNSNETAALTTTTEQANSSRGQAQSSAPDGGPGI